ncbi:hypothetical protein ACA910_019023 [Epithemia clementina (nom. ined.)]
MLNKNSLKTILEVIMLEIAWEQLHVMSLWKIKTTTKVHGRHKHWTNKRDGRIGKNVVRILRIVPKLVCLGMTKENLQQIKGDLAYVTHGDGGSVTGTAHQILSQDQ